MYDKSKVPRTMWNFTNTNVCYLIEQLFKYPDKRNINYTKKRSNVEKTRTRDKLNSWNDGLLFRELGHAASIITRITSNIRVNKQNDESLSKIMEKYSKIQRPCSVSTSISIRLSYKQDHWLKSYVLVIILVILGRVCIGNSHSFPSIQKVCKVAASCLNGAI